MTTAASFTSLHAPLADDNMEMSSPAHPVYDDDDIDIDFDDHVGGVELADDDRMADDTEQPRPGTATDDMMEDDAPAQDAQVPEQEMQDDFDPAAYEQGDPDDELIDYDDEEYQDMSEVKEQPVYEPAAPEITLQDREPTDADFEKVDEEIVREPENSAPAQEVVVEESAPEVVTAVLETSAPEEVAAPVADETFEGSVNATGDHSGVEVDANVAAADVVAATDDQHRETTPVVDHVEEPFPELPEDSPELKAVAQVPAPIETNLDAGNDAPCTPTDTGLHPMFVQYGDREFPLFKSRRQPEGLLKDDNLASVALADLLNSCRTRLALKAGEDISEDEEFVLRFDGLNLTIVENSSSSFNTSLDEILAVFKQLYVNGGAQSIPPFWMSLSLQVKPSSHLAMLKHAAAGGHSISDLADVLDNEIPEDYEEYYQEGGEDPTLLGDASGIDHEDQAQADGHQPQAEPELNEANHNEYDTSYENTEGGQEAHDGHDQYDQYDEAQQAENETQQEVDEAQQAEFEAHEDNEGQHADVAAEHVEETNEVHQPGETEDALAVSADVGSADLTHEAEPSVAAPAPEVTDNATGELRDGGDEDHDPAQTSNVESAASSTTLRADQTNDDIDDYSEYKGEDLIDWNESTLTSRPSENNAYETDDFSTFLTENGLEESADVGNANEENEHTVDTDPNTNVAAAEEHDHAADGPEETVDTADIDFEVDETEYPEEEVDPDAPVGQVEAVANGEAQEQEQAEVQVHTNGVEDATTEPSDTAGTEKPHADVAPSKEPIRNEEDYIDFGDEDDIDFDDDTYEEHEARKASEANTPGSKSPSGKRPLDEAGDAEQPELKKVKSS